MEAVFQRAVTSEKKLSAVSYQLSALGTCVVAVIPSAARNLVLRWHELMLECGRLNRIPVRDSSRAHGMTVGRGIAPRQRTTDNGRLTTDN
jgi:hypothetical protein